jgi:hypothetical protein
MPGGAEFRTGLSKCDAVPAAALAVVVICAYPVQNADGIRVRKYKDLQIIFKILHWDPA